MTTEIATVNFEKLTVEQLEAATIPQMLELLPGPTEWPSDRNEYYNTRRFIAGWRKISERGVLGEQVAAEYTTDFGVSPDIELGRMMLLNSVNENRRSGGDYRTLKPHYKTPFRGTYFGIRHYEVGDESKFRLERLGVSGE